MILDWFRKTGSVASVQLHSKIINHSGFYAASDLKDLNVLSS